MTEKMPSSVKLGSRPRIFKSRWYSLGVSPCSATISGRDLETALGFGIHARALGSLGAIQGVQMLALIAAEFGVVAPLRYVPIAPRPRAHRGICDAAMTGRKASRPLRAVLVGVARGH